MIVTWSEKESIVTRVERAGRELSFVQEDID